MRLLGLNKLERLGPPDLLIVLGLLAALAPWMSGGRDALAMLISSAGLAIAGVLALRRYSLDRTASGALAISIGVWIGWGALSQLWSVNRYQTQMWVLMILMAALAAVIVVVLPRLNRIWLLGGYLLMSVALTLVGIYMYLTGDYDRLTGSFYWANPAAAYLMPAALLASWWGVHRRNYWLIATGLITATGFWLTDSRGATISLLIVIIAAVLASRQVRSHWKGLVLVALLSFAAAWGISQFKGGSAVQPGSRYAEAAQGESTSGSDRLHYLQASFAIWWDHPFTGTGAGTFASVHPQYQTSPTQASSDPHNFYVQALAEQGIVGVSLLAWVLLLIIAGVVNGVARHPERAPIALAAAALLIHFGLDINGRYPAILVLVAVLLALSYRPLVRSEAPAHARPTILLLLVITLGLAMLNFQSAQAHQNAKIHDDNIDYDKAAESNQRARSIVIHDPDYWNAEGIDYYVLASFYFDRPANLDRARQMAQAAIQRDPQDAQHHFLLGRVERLSGNPGVASSAFERALQLDPYNHAEYYADLVSLQLDVLKDKPAAQATLDRALGIYSDEVIQNRSADVQMKPAVVQLLLFKAQLQLEDGDLSGAQASIERAKRYDSQHPFIPELEQRLTNQQSAV